MVHAPKIISKKVLTCPSSVDNSGDSEDHPKIHRLKWPHSDPSISFLVIFKSGGVAIAVVAKSLIRRERILN